MNGVRTADPSGTATNPATFVISGATAAVARYVTTFQDGDGLSNLLEFATGSDPTRGGKAPGQPIVFRTASPANDFERDRREVAHGPAVLHGLLAFFGRGRFFSKQLDDEVAFGARLDC